MVLVAWLVLPQFRGASFIYEKFVREQLRKYGAKMGANEVHRSPMKVIKLPFLEDMVAMTIRRMIVMMMIMKMTSINHND